MTCSDRLDVAALDRHAHLAAHQFQQDQHPVGIELCLKYALKIGHRPALNSHLIARRHGAAYNLENAVIASPGGIIQAF